MAEPELEISEGPFFVDQIHPGDPYELSDGHPIYCAPSGSDSGRGVIAGALALDTDPDVDSSGAEVGYASDDKTLRAPDLAIGNVPDKSGWVIGAPPIALEYAGSGQNEADLKKKIAEFLDAGTKYVWVVRLVRGRRVEVYEKGKRRQTKTVGQVLTAPGVLRNPVPVEALFDRNVAHDVAFRNLLARHGYGNLDEVREEGLEQGLERGLEQGLEQGLKKGLEKGRQEGLEEGLQRGVEAGLQRGLLEAIFAVLESRGIQVSEAQRARISSVSQPETLSRWVRDAVRVNDAAELLE